MRGITQILITMTTVPRPCRGTAKILATETPGRGIANFLLPVTENLHTLGNIARMWYDQRWSKGPQLGVAFFLASRQSPPLGLRPEREHAVLLAC